MSRCHGFSLGTGFSCFRSVLGAPSLSFYPGETSINLDSAIDTSHKSVGSQETNGASEQTINQTRQEAVAEEQHRADQTSDMQMIGVVIHAVKEDPDRRRAADEERLPPPVVVLGAKLNVNGDDGRLHDGEDQNAGDDGEVAEHVIVAALVLPEISEDE